MQTERAQRITSVDAVRGAVMVFMALDHVRDYTTNLRIQPEDLSQSTPALFATRWITHFCAPTFFLLAGVGIGILLQRGKTPAELSRYLVTRGLWLLVLELILTPIGWQFGFDLVPAFALVLWALGWSMIVMAVLVHVPRNVLLVLSLVVIFGHNLLDPMKPDAFGSMAGLWHALHAPGFILPGVLFVGYPLIPWFAVMCLGYVLAQVFDWNVSQRRRALLLSGTGALALFVLLRAVNGYGNPDPWTAQRSTALTIASFLNVRKYPPSLDFLLMTLGPALIALALIENARGRIASWLSVYGRVPLFFYVTHIFVAHAAAMVLRFIQFGEIARVPIIHHPETIPATYGVGLPGVYLVWAIVVILLYYPCRQFARMKSSRSDWWLSYL